MPPSTLRLGEAFVPEALAASNVGAWEYDLLHDRFRFDPAIAALFEFSESEAKIGLPLERLAVTIHPDDQDDAGAKRRHIFLRGGLFVMEYHNMPLHFRIVAIENVTKFRRRATLNNLDVQSRQPC